jgi:hypothetical protein
VRASLPLLGATIGGALGHPGPTGVRALFSGTSDKPTSAARIVYSLKIAEAGSEPSSTIFITWWSLVERWKTSVKIVLAAAHFHGFGVVLGRPWITWVNKGSSVTTCAKKDVQRAEDPSPRLSKRLLPSPRDPIPGNDTGRGVAL